MGSAAVALWVAYEVWEVPDPAEVAAAQNQTVTLYYSDGKTELARIQPEDGARTLVRLDDVPKHVQDAVLAAENASFWTDDGFSFKGILGAVYNNLRGADGGGSTITQQYIKKATGKEERTLTRKIRELVLAKKLTDTYDKREILAAYLNTVYFGRGAHGIQAAAKAYFGKNVQDLTLNEGALLAGVIQSPTFWDPAVDKVSSENRWNYVLDRMVDANFLPGTERGRASFPRTVPVTSLPGSRLHIRTQVLAELEKSAKINLDEAQQHGYKIVTTLDKDAQGRTENIMREVMAGQPDYLRSASVSIDPRTGGVVAYYGGADGVGIDYAQTLQEPGTSFAPFVLVAAGQRGVPVGQFEIGTGRTVELAKRVGQGHVADVAHESGIPREVLGQPTIVNPTAEIAIGGGKTFARPFDMAAAYATLAAEGMRTRPHFVSKVLGPEGDARYEFKDNAKPVFDTRNPRRNAFIARQTTATLATTDTGLPNVLPDPLAVAVPGVLRFGSDGEVAKAWTVGYTPQLATAVWVGSDKFRPIKGRYREPGSREHDITGRDEPAAVWNSVMRLYHQQRSAPTEPPLAPLARPGLPTVTRPR
ncbi:transglycosylase domain-containing protein [Longimycelium tulufanense]|uniref:transglycosylase domain-containing protein n=1 Tax=Longimycelium tulufanense TaxID=907463 RepID=UPI00166C11CA|nr:transglycosylase domain-containing protein [Longimycelium tulufanense]